MKAIRNVGGNLVEITVDTDKHGNPILPPDTTVDPKPEALEGHYVTVVGKEWVQIPVTVVVTSFEAAKAKVLADIETWRNWVMDQPVEYQTVLFDADEQARNRLVQVKVIYDTNAYLPPAWITYANTPFPVAGLQTILDLINVVQTAFAERFFSSNTIRGQVMAATTQAELDAIEVPKIPGQL